MKILARYSIKSIITVFLVSMLIFSFLVMAVETFMHLDSFMTGDISMIRIAEYALLSLSKYYMMLASVSLLFSITYFLSNMSASNESLALYSAGFSRMRILSPLIAVSLALTAIFLVFNETGGLLWKTQCSVISQELFGLSGTQDVRRITLHDEESGYLIYADRYSESYHRLYNPILIKTEGAKIIERVEADYADYSDGLWTFSNAAVVDASDGLKGFTRSSFSDSGFIIPEELFRSQNLSMETMQAKAAYEYLSRLKNVNRMAWQEGMTDFISRVTEPLGILILSAIAMSMSYSFKKNVFLFSIVQSLVIAVVYYVANMVFSIASRQGAIETYTLVYLPSLITMALSYVLSLLAKRI